MRVMLKTTIASKIGTKSSTKLPLSAPAAAITSKNMDNKTRLATTQNRTNHIRFCSRKEYAMLSELATEIRNTPVPYNAKSLVGEVRATIDAIKIIQYGCVTKK